MPFLSLPVEIQHQILTNILLPESFLFQPASEHLKGGEKPLGPPHASLTRLETICSLLDTSVYIQSLVKDVLEHSELVLKRQIDGMTAKAASFAKELKESLPEGAWTITSCESAKDYDILHRTILGFIRAYEDVGVALWKLQSHPRWYEKLLPMQSQMLSEAKFGRLELEPVWYVVLADDEVDDSFHRYDWSLGYAMKTTPRVDKPLVDGVKAEGSVSVMYAWAYKDTYLEKPGHFEKWSGRHMRW